MMNISSSNNSKPSTKIITCNQNYPKEQGRVFDSVATIDTTKPRKSDTDDVPKPVFPPRGIDTAVAKMKSATFDAMSDACASLTDNDNTVTMCALHTDFLVRIDGLSDTTTTLSTTTEEPVGNAIR